MCFVDNVGKLTYYEDDEHDESSLDDDDEEEENRSYFYFLDFLVFLLFCFNFAGIIFIFFIDWL